MSTRLSSFAARAGRTLALLSLLAAGAAVLAPTGADARLGGGGSSGSRGGRTFSMPSATPTAPRVAPIERSQTAAPFNNGFAGNARPGFFSGGFGRGLVGGFLGAGLFGLLFGHGLTGGLGGGLSLIGLVLQLALLFFAVRFVMGFFRNRQPAFGGPAGSVFGGGGFSGGGPNAGGFGGGAPARPAGVPIQIGPDDYQAFERRLSESQAAYSAGDVGTLRRIATPEMAGNFEAELGDNARQGVVNRISDVRLVSGDLSEAWREGSSDYATVAMRFSLVDVTLDQRTNRVVAGDPSHPQDVTEVWTFVRPAGAPASAWTLSAIQQT